MPTDEGQDARFREIDVERVVLREPGRGRVRAILETVGAEHDEESDSPTYPTVRLSLRNAAGDDVLEAEVGPNGEVRVTLGAGEQNLVVTPHGVGLWAGGNEVAALDSGAGGRLQLCDRNGRIVLRLPNHDS